MDATTYGEGEAYAHYFESSPIRFKEGDLVLYGPEYDLQWLSRVIRWDEAFGGWILEHWNGNYRPIKHSNDVRKATPDEIIKWRNVWKDHWAVRRKEDERKL